RIPGRPPPDALALLARRAPARARTRALARPLHVPTGGEAAAELRRLAVRVPLLAARYPLRARRRLERPAARDLPARPAPDVRVAPRTRAPAGTRARGRARLRNRPVPRAAERRPSARPDLDHAPALSVGVRARLALAVGARACIDPAVRPGASRARCDPVRR